MLNDPTKPEEAAARMLVLSALSADPDTSREMREVATEMVQDLTPQERADAILLAVTFVLSLEALEDALGDINIAGHILASPVIEA